ncbi:hypothetical protein AJ79_04671 [Helicocarpus griseus UAMH5409]|uniref:Xylanolytic transcriptional activator regulatory domain-containing protein n=1 Tax=Helicocarpus griseus UAMH5409 TaxID=1447875 RepID=A0A2B7XS14_9EURO|nr:hypothetical protein AJ79_04671 [Helicocarpus griseus UAMH5409]
MALTNSQCNRQWPCNNCAGSRAHLCRYDHTVKRSTSTANRSTGDLSPPSSTRSATDEYAEQSDSEILESLGYVTGSASPLAREVLGTSPSENSFFLPSGIGKATHDPRRNRDAILDLFPDRHVVDFLIQYFLQEVNWIYETTYPPTFMERYTSWWLQTTYQESDDIQFGILILRLCLCSIQLLPHPNYPHEGTLQCSLKELEMQCQNAANALDSFRPRHTSLTRIQHLFYYASFHTNESNLRESWIVLSDVVKEAHMLELHLENPKVKVTEFEMEMRRRIFGTIYMWDKLMSVLQGHWPLIPDVYCDVDLPRDALPAAPSVPGAPTPFTDRIIQMRLSRLLSAQNAREERKSKVPNPASILATADTINTEIVSTLPAPYRLSDFDEQFDAILPSIPLKREQLRVVIIGALATAHRPFTGLLHEPNFTDLSSAKEQKTAFKLQRNLIEYSMDIIQSTIRLADMLPGGSKRLFLINLVALESSVVLGLCLRGLRRNRRAYVHLSRQGLAALTENSDLENPANAVFLEALNLLNDLSNYSEIAAKGSQIVRSLYQKLQRDATIDNAEHELYSHASSQLLQQQQQQQHQQQQQQQRQQQHEQQQQQQRVQQATAWGPAAGAEMMAGPAITNAQVGNMMTAVPVTTSVCGPQMAMDPYAWSQMTAPPPPDMTHYAHAAPAPHLAWYYDDSLVERYATSTL